MAKMMELAREKQAAELKALKETSETYDCFPSTSDFRLSKRAQGPPNISLMPVSLQ